MLERMASDLLDAQQDLLTRLNSLANRSGLGGQVRQDQLGAINKHLTVVQNELWQELAGEITEGGVAIADAASGVQAVSDKMLFASAGVDVPEELVRAQQAYAREVVNTYWSRMENNISLSQQVYRTQALSQGWVDRAINRAILQGASWRDLMNAVKPYIDPNTPGGVSYAAKRLARTELNNAFHRTQVRLGEGNPWVAGQKWNLSTKHPRADACDPYAHEQHYEGGDPGVYRADKVPRKPHPQCFCFITAVNVSEDEFFDRLMAGDYEDATEHFLTSPPTAALRRAG